MHTNLISGLIHATIAAPGGGKNVAQNYSRFPKNTAYTIPMGGGFPGGPENVPKKCIFQFLCRS